MKRSIVVLVVAVLFIVFSCTKVIGEGPLVTEERFVGNFTGISSEMSGKVNFTIAPVYKVEIAAQRNILDVLKTDVVKGVLHIDFKNSARVRAHEDLTINISAPAADYFRLSGSGNLNVSGDLAADNLEIKLSGSGNIAIDKAIIANKIDADISGSGNIKMMNGSAMNEDLNITGSGKIDFAGIAAENAVTHTSGSGDMRLMMSKSLDAKISGSGSVYYHGNPLITSHTSGSGKVIPF